MSEWDRTNGSMSHAYEIIEQSFPGYILKIFLLQFLTGHASGSPLEYQLEDVILPVTNSHGAVASETLTCSQIGVDLLQHGVSIAVDMRSMV